LKNFVAIKGTAQHGQSKAAQCKWYRVNGNDEGWCLRRTIAALRAALRSTRPNGANAIVADDPSPGNLAQARTVSS
jgi:hypothetical protein